MTSGKSLRTADNRWTFPTNYSTQQRHLHLSFLPDGSFPLAMLSKIYTHITVSGNILYLAFCVPAFSVKFRMCSAEKFGQSQMW